MSLEAAPPEITAAEYLEREDELTREAAEALPGSIDRCSFDKGYVNQQIFSCLTCASKRAEAHPDTELTHIGVCYACFVQCHTTHNVVEMFYRRAFRCDCGIMESPKECCLQKSSIGKTNEKNKYDGTFEGRFCWCKSEYQYEKEVKMEDATMFQCHICEDWVPDEESFDDFICKSCVGRHPFLTGYIENPLFTFVEHTEGDSKTSLKRKNGEDNPVTGEDSIAATDSVNGVEVNVEVADPGPVEPDAKKPHLEGKYISHSDSTYEDGVCRIKDKTLLTGPSNHNLFLTESWKSALCLCPTCLPLYATIPFITTTHDKDDESTSDFEPEPDADATLSLLDLGMKQLERIPRVNALEGIHAYKEMAESIKGYLKEFAESGKVVTKEDVHRFFDALKEKALEKKQ
ncbi:hypothetical protein BC829DRAFT_390516 [Chytridium lagenaria]|nr:hypothetical protein BC829DRAFT_390516 [Chytridium lagenaria]